MADITASSRLPYSQDEAYREKVRARRGKPFATCPHGVKWRTTETGGIELQLGDLMDGEEFEVHMCEAMSKRDYFRVKGGRWATSKNAS